MRIRFLLSEPNPFKSGPSGIQSDTAQSNMFVNRALGFQKAFGTTPFPRMQSSAFDAWFGKTNYTEFDTKTKNRNKHIVIALFGDNHNTITSMV